MAAELQSQADIVKEFTMRQEKGDEVVEPVRLPGLADHFWKAPDAALIVSDNVRVPGLKELAVKSRKEIAETLTWVLDYKPGVVGFSWTVTSPDMQIRYVEGFEQRAVESEADRERVSKLFTLILQVRREITAIKWDFGAPFIEISHIV